MIQKGTDDYRMAGKIANRIADCARCMSDRQDAAYDFSKDALSRVMEQVLTLDIFAAEIAKTISASWEKYGRPYVSDKQSWILACAIVENRLSVIEWLA